MWTKIWTKIKESFFTALTAAIILLVVFVLVWIPIKFIPKIFNGFQNEVASSLSSMLIPADRSEISVSKKTITNGEGFEIRISNPLEDGEYLLSYPCTSGVQLKLADSNKTEISCGQEFYLLRNDGRFNLIGYSAERRYVSLPITISYLKDVDDKILKIDSIRIAITNTSSITEAEEIIEENNYSNTSPVYYNGNPDLLVRTLEKGVMDRNTGTFRKTDYITSTDRVAIKFEVRNIGEGKTGSWYFTANLPSSATPYYTSSSQISLNPGDRMEFTLSFDGINTAGQNTLTIQVDPSNTISEIVETNNTLAEYFTINYSDNNYNYNYNNNWNDNYNNYGNISGSCYASPSYIQTGSSVTWYATASGGTGSYTYSWSGTDGLSGYGQSITKAYYGTGTKTATVTIASGGQSITRDCIINVYSGYPYTTGKTDLVARIIGVGYLDSNGNFINASSFSKNSTVVIKLEVKNNGQKASGLWDVSATMLPSMTSYTYRSENIASLNAGDRTEMTITFNNPSQSGNNTITVNVDPNLKLDESDRTNNSVSSTVYIY